jgi:hypothetical protein
MLKKNWPICFGNTRVHQWAIPVAVNVSHETLVWAVPSHLAHIIAAEGPLAETFEMLMDTQGNIVGDEVHNCIPQACSGLKIDRHMQEVISSRKTIII